MLALELVDQDDLVSEILPALTDDRGAEHADDFVCDRRGWRNLDSLGERYLRLRAFHVAIQNENALVRAVIRNVCGEGHLHHRLCAIPCVAPNRGQRMNVDVELGLAPQPVADALGYRVEDQRERLEQSFECGFYRAGFGRGVHWWEFITRFESGGNEGCGFHSGTADHGEGND